MNEWLSRTGRERGTELEREWDYPTNQSSGVLRIDSFGFWTSFFFLFHAYFFLLSLLVVQLVDFFLILFGRRLIDGLMD